MNTGTAGNVDVTGGPESPPPFKGSFRLRLLPDGEVVAPDLAGPLIPLLRRAGADEGLWRPQPCAADVPVLRLTRRARVGLTRAQVVGSATEDLWRVHRRAAPPAGDGPPDDSLPDDSPTDAGGEPDGGGAASLLDVKVELAGRMLRHCMLCERRCAVDRGAGPAGFCGLGAGAQVGAYAMLYNEGPLVGAPTFGLFVRGCSLRCSFCYRPDELRARGRDETPPAGLAAVLDRAAARGARSWHFLGGNPDESLPAILLALSLTRESLPVVWNSALMLTPDAIELLKRVVDVWLPDFKFGNDACARRVAGFEGYTAVLRRNLSLLAGQPRVVVRHMRSPGHEACCTAAVGAFVREHCAGFLLHAFPMHAPPRR